VISGQGGRFLPLERYVVNLCGEIPVPIQGKNQIEVAVRELRYDAFYREITDRG